MKTYNQFINESIRDKMLPKSEKEIEDAYRRIINNINSPISTFEEQGTEFDEIAELFGDKKENLYLIGDIDDYFNELNDLFWELTEGQKPIDIKVNSPFENLKGGWWECYPEVKVAYWCSDNLGEMDAWIFSKNIIIKK